MGYDYVIIGAGSAGCVLAGRLSEDPDVRVLVLEAGPPDDAPEVAVPVAWGQFGKGPYDWDYTSTPQPHAGSRSIWIPRGRVLGGSSTINGMAYVRGNRLDFDEWRDRYGCPGWGYTDLLPYFRKAEDHEHGESPFRGAGGPMRIEDVRYRPALGEAWVEAAKAWGLPFNPDYNGAEQDGAAFYQLNQRAGRRWSTVDGYLRPATERENLAVRTGTLVSRVLIEGGRASGVRFRQDGTEHEVRAEREVVLAAGVINSPQLLMLSGIGPAEHLRHHSIDVIADAPMVGVGLQDHPGVPVMWRTPGTPGPLELATPENAALWERDGLGPMSGNGCEAIGFVRSRSDLPAPDLQLVVLPLPFVNQGLVPPDWRALTLGVVCADVASRGQISLRSADPADKPVVDPGTLADDADLETLLAGVRIAREIGTHEPLASQLAEEVVPGVQIADDEAALRYWARGNAVQVFHPTSSCAMGGAETSVCDPELRVRGVDGLRVVDASVFPKVTRGNTQAPVIAVAERAADLIRGVPARKPTGP